MLDVPNSRESEINHIKMQLKTLPLFVVLHTLLWLFDIYSNRTYMAFFSISILIIAVEAVGLFTKELGQSLRAIQIGLIPILLMIFIPKYAIFAICNNFICLASGSHEVPLSKVHYLVISNGIGWLLCYQFLYLDGYEGAELVKLLLKDKDNFFQLMLSFVACYLIILSMYQKKSQETKFYANYQATLISLNKELETANAKLKSANKELEEALQEKENFILRFSHEIRNPLNSLLGNVELCYELAKESELKSMLTDARVSGEILLQLLNNVLDTAKVAAGRLELSASPHRIREYLERAWVICSEIIHKKGLYGCLSVCERGGARDSRVRLSSNDADSDQHNL